MIVTHYEQGSPDWHHARCGVRTASRFGDVMAMKPEQWRVLAAGGSTKKVCATREEADEIVASAVKAVYTVEHEPEVPYAAYQEYLLEQACEIITGVFDDGQDVSTFWIDRGHELEPDARRYYEFVTGRRSEECGLILTDDRQVGASVDGLVDEDPEGPGQNEIKCLKRTNHTRIVLEDKVPDAFIPQIQGQMFVTGRAWCDFIAYHPTAPVPGFIRRVYRDEVYMARLQKCLDRFNADLSAMVERLTELREAA